MRLTTILDAITSWAQSLIDSLGYPGLGLVMFLESILPVIPSEAILPLAGSLTLDGRFSLLGISLVGTLGSLGGALVFYGLGHWLGEARLQKLLEHYGRWFSLSAADMDRTKAWFTRYGEPIIFFGRMMPMVRSLISIPAGLAGMNLQRFVLYTFLGSILWNLLLAWGGRLLGQNWLSISAWIGQYEHAVLVTLPALITLFVIWRRWTGRKK